MTVVLNLSTGTTLTFSCSPAEAVVAAHAQHHGDFNTWDYAAKYAGNVRRGERVVGCGDFTAMLDRTHKPAAPKKTTARTLTAADRFLRMLDKK